MLDALWHLRGTVAIDRRVSRDDGVFGPLTALLERQGKRVSRPDRDRLNFENGGGASLFAGAHAFAMFERGEFEVEDAGGERVLRYRLRSAQVFVFALGGGGMFSTLFVSTGAGLPIGTGVGVLAFSWLYGMNVLVARLRVPPLIRRVLGGDHQGQLLT